MQVSRGFALLLFSPLAFGCKDVTRYSTAPGESYCGQIVDATFVRRGFDQKLKLSMTLDANRLADAPGTLTTDDQVLSSAPMRPVPELSHDPFSTLNFGEGRDKNLLFAVDPADPAKGPTIMVVVSLMHAGDAEVRLMRGAWGPDATTASPPLFGVFAPLVRKPDPCW